LTNGGTMTTAGTVNMNGGSTSNSGTLSITGGTFAATGGITNSKTLTEAAGSTITIGGALTNGGTMTTAGTVNMNGGSASNSGTLSITGGTFGPSSTTSFSFTNSGTFDVAAGSTFKTGSAGSVTQTAGTTTDDGTITAGTGGLDLNGGSLIGKGTINGNVTNGNSTSGGTITPGNSTSALGTLTDNGTFTQSSKGSLDINIGGTAAGTFDVLNIKGAATLAGTLNAALVGGFTATIGQSFTIMDFTSHTGTFSDTEIAINGNEHFNVTVNATDVVLTVAAGAAAAKNGSALTPQPRFGHRIFVPIGKPLESNHRLVFPLAGMIPLQSPRSLGSTEGLSLFRTGKTPAELTTPSRFAMGNNPPAMPLNSGHRLVFPVAGMTGILPRPVSLGSTLLIHSRALGAPPVFPARLQFSSNAVLHAISPNPGFGAFPVRPSLQIAAAASRFAGNFGAPQGGAVFGSQSFRPRPDFGLYADAMKASRARSMSSPSLRGSGFNGLRGRTLVGGFSLPVSNLLSKPKFGVAVQ